MQTSPQVQKPTTSTSFTGANTVKKPVQTYQPKLVPSLVKGNKSLEEIFKAISTAVTRKKYRQAGDLMGKFRATLYDNVIKENSVLSPALKKHYSGNQEMLQTIKSARKAVDQGVRDINAFMGQWRSINIIEDNPDGFIAAHRLAEKALESRIKQFEAELNPLYEKTSNVTLPQH